MMFLHKTVISRIAFPANNAKETAEALEKSMKADHSGKITLAISVFAHLSWIAGAKSALNSGEYPVLKHMVFP